MREIALAPGDKQGQFSFEEPGARIMGATWPPPDSNETRAQAIASGLIPDEAMLAALSVALGAATVPAITEQEAALLDGAPDVPGDLIAATLEKIQEGSDPLQMLAGDARAVDEGSVAAGEIGHGESIGAHHADGGVLA